MMDFQKVTCWNRSLLPRVMDTDALQMEDHIFLATHHPMRMTRANNRTARVLNEHPVWSQEDLHQELMQPDIEYRLCAILGAPGSGKSHLVRWLWLHLQKNPDPKRHLVLVRRGANLRGVVELILEGMGPEFDHYRERLRNAASRLSSAQATRELFLSDLAVAVGPNGPPVPPLEDRNAQEAREELIEGLPYLLRSSAFMKELTKPNGIVDDLVMRVTGQGVGGRDEAKQSFSTSDLAVGGWRLSETDFDREARPFYRQIRFSSEVQQQSVDWINLNLEWAMTRLLGLGSEDLQRLMADVRATLFEQGKELVLLVEDLSNLQGIDAALLEALLQRPQQEKRLCNLRAVVALTTQYYLQAVDANARERIELAVTLDVAEDSGSGSDPTNGDNLAQFASRYLNAVRLDDEVLRKWYQESGLDESFAVPNACEPCPFRGTCHDGFDEKDEIGLYPFTAQALETMYERAKGEKEYFNPRVFIGSVLRRTLDIGSVEVKEGRFPQPALSTEFNSPAVPMRAERAEQIRRAVPESDRLRALTLLELWGEPDTWNATPGARAVIENAFVLPLGKLPPAGVPLPPIPQVINRGTTTVVALNGNGSSPVSKNGRTVVDTSGDGGPDVEPVPDPPSVPQVEKLSDDIERHFKALDVWQSGGALEEKLAAHLRELLFAALKSHIDWNAEMLAAAYFCDGPQKPFQRTSILFKRPSTNHSKPSVTLSLPLDNNFDGLAITFKGLLRHRHYGHWNFPEGANALLRFGDLLEACAQEVLRQLRSLEGGTDLVPAIAELLVVGAQLNGRPAALPASDEAALDALFGDFPKPLDTKHTTHWRALQTDLNSQALPLSEALRARILCNKGLSNKGQMIDAAVLVASVRATRADWKLHHAAPTQLTAKVRKAIEDRLPQVIESEVLELQTWLQNINLSIPTGTSASEVVQALQTTVSAAEAASVTPSLLRLRSALEAAKLSNITDCRASVEAILADETPARLVPLSRLDLSEPMAVGTELLEAANQYLTTLNTRLQTERANVTGGAAVETLNKSIQTDLKELCDIFQDFGDSTP